MRGYSGVFSGNWAVVALLLALAGCQFPQFSSGLISDIPGDDLPAQHDSPDKPPRAAVEALRAHLEQDAWASNSEWTPLVHWAGHSWRSERSQPASRWRFRGHDAATWWNRAAALHDDPQLTWADGTAATNGQMSGKSDATGSNSALTWNGRIPDESDRARSPNTGDSNVDASQNTGIAADLLLQLASENNIAGWNAMILWAQHVQTTSPVPPHAHSRLRELALAPPRLPRKLPRPSDVETAEAPVKSASEPELGNSSNETESQLETRISPEMRAAALGAWLRIRAAAGEDPARLQSDADTAFADTELPLTMWAELFAALAENLPPEFEIPRLAHALDVTASGGRAPEGVRRAAIDACLIRAIRAPGRHERHADDRDAYPSDKHWPREIWNCATDPDPRVRLRFAQWLASTRPPRAFESLERLTSDAEPRVRIAACIGLGVLQSDAARESLLSLAQHPHVDRRAEALVGLAAWGPATLGRFAQDSAHEVRRLLAREAARTAGLDAALLIRELLVDRNPQVREAAVTAIDDWPDHLAIPLYLHGIRRSWLATRQACFQQLRGRVGFLENALLVELPEDEREDELLRLVHRYALPASLMEFADEAAYDASVAAAESIPAEELRATLQTLASPDADPRDTARAKEHLQQVAHRDLPLVERLLEELPRHELSKLLREDMAKVAPPYAALAELESSETVVRKRAVQKLREIAQTRSLSPLVVRRIREHLVHEQDRQIWQDAIAAVSRDGTEESAQIALLAVNHMWPDIQVLGCRYIADIRRPEHARWLLPLLSDKNSDVQYEAVVAAGLCNNRVVLDGLPATGDHEELPGLRSLLATGDERLRSAAVISMSRLGDPDGMRELIRMSYDETPSARDRAVREMGETGQSRFVEHLINMAWTEPSDGVRSTILQSLNRLVPPADRPDGLAETTATDDKIRLWVDWWERRRLARAAAPPLGG